MLKAESSGAGLPEEVWEKVAAVQAKGGYGMLKKLTSDSGAWKTDCESHLERAKQLLAEESREDENYRKLCVHCRELHGHMPCMRVFFIRS